MGNRVRNFRILEALSREFELTIVTLVHDRRRLEDPGPIAQLGDWRPVLASHRASAGAKFAWHLRARWSRWREGLHAETYFQSLPALAREVERAVDRVKPDLVHAAYWYSLRRIRRFPRPPIWVVDTHDVQYERHARVFGQVSSREAEQELAQLARYDHILAITAADAATLRTRLGADARIEVAPMGVDLDAWDEGESRPALRPALRVGFYGNLSTPANQAAARELLHQVRPAIRAQEFDPEFVLLGATPPRDLRRLDAVDGVRVPGFVEDVRPWLKSMSVLALPLRAGSGQRGRVLEALAARVPVVAYPEAIAGLELDGAGITIVTGPTEMAAALIGLLRDDSRRRTCADAGRAEVEARYSWSATYGRFPALYGRWIEEEREPRSDFRGSP